MKPDDRAQNISNCQYRYEEYIKSLKMDGFDVIGYARKMKDVYVSPSSRSKSLIAARDMATDKDYTDVRGCVGNTQSLLKYLSSTTKKVCFVIVYYAALSTDPDDILLLQLVSFDCRPKLPQRSI
ncbi:uncharacterized protein EV154DRAFT_535603 [Mucor mucedo]|uniref:uncharacterized protein n=1 Tax=Mucor mucedo TaxID=29922 RepID=UPI00222110DA|nr:uncharacterized protein EV154DRAFT_535603 [Mucor mucedo]KAI7896634.1 hypothetical protein EV154DRAFT_535603 [Mucor mucedo]